jgi:hypothetical protein
VDKVDKDAAGAGGEARLAEVPGSRCKVALVLGVCGWLIALLALWWCWQTQNEARFAAATAIGLSEAEVRAGAGPPDVVLAPGQAASTGRLGAYEMPARHVEQAALVYFRFRHAVLVFIGPDGFVQAVYWARAR